MKFRPVRSESPKPMDKLVQGTPEDHIDHHMASEHFDAHMNKDPKLFRSSLDAIVMNMFEPEDVKEETQDGE